MRVQVIHRRPKRLPGRPAPDFAAKKMLETAAPSMSVHTATPGGRNLNLPPRRAARAARVNDRALRWILRCRGLRSDVKSRRAAQRDLRLYSASVASCGPDVSRVLQGQSVGLLPMPWPMILWAHLNVKLWAALLMG